jgi:HAD superfamily hydrolase (TIGR01549 family)
VRPMAICFDVGGTLVDESSMWRRLAAWLDVPVAEYLAVLGEVIAAGHDHGRAFELLCPETDVEAEIRRRDAAGFGDLFGPEDLRPDARATLAALRARGHQLLIAANQPARSGEILRAMGLPVDAIAVSDDWGVAKPDPAFYARVRELAGRPAAEIAYVGDRLDKDVLPSRAAGLASIFIRRGPWGVIHARWPDAALADHVIDQLSELVGLSPALGGVGTVVA